MNSTTKNTTKKAVSSTSKPTKVAQRTYQKQTTQVHTDTSNVQVEVNHILDTRGLFGVMIIIILEMATPIGILFPTDAIVFGSGLYFSAKGTIRGGIWTLMILFMIAVVLGDILGYGIGRAFSTKIATMQDNRFFKRKYLTMCQHYFDDYGNKTMIVSKFLPIRSIIPLVAGVIMKPIYPFIAQSILSSVLWIGSLLGISYFIIWLIPAAKNHIGLLTFLFVVLPQIASVRYMIKPMMKKYESRIAQTSENIQHIEEEISAIGNQFSAIGHEIKEIVQKIIKKDDEQNIDESIEKALGDPISTPLPLPGDLLSVQAPSQLQTQISDSPDILKN